MGIGWETGATTVLLLAGRSDDDRVLHRACDSSITTLARGSIISNIRPKVRRTQSRSIKRLHIENVYALHLPEDLQSFQSGGLFEIGGDGTGLGTRSEEVVLALDICSMVSRFDSCRSKRRDCLLAHGIGERTFERSHLGLLSGFRYVSRTQLAVFVVTADGRARKAAGSDGLERHSPREGECRACGEHCGSN